MAYRRLGMILLTMAALAGCARASAIAPTSTPVAVATASGVLIGASSGGDTVVASGQIVPAQEAQLGFPIFGQVQAVGVAEGDEVETGDPLVTLETILLEADVAQAEAALMVAPRRARALIRAGAEEAVRRAAEIAPYAPEFPLTVRWQFKDSGIVDRYRGDATRIDATMLEKVVHDPEDVVVP